MAELKDIKKEIIGKTLKTIISLDVNSSNTLQEKAITDCDFYDNVDMSFRC